VGTCLVLLAAAGCQSSGPARGDRAGTGDPGLEPGGAATPGMQGESTGETARVVPGDEELLRRFQSHEPGEQRVALTELSVSPDPRMAPYIAACLESPDPIVRYQATTVLSDLGARNAVEPLIGLLDDAEPFVRSGAYVALRKITGQPIEFLPYGSEPERRTAQEAWRQWWMSRGR